MQARMPRTAACCAVREHGGVDAVEDALDEGLGASIVHLVLGAFVIKNDIEGKSQVGMAMAAPDMQSLGRLCGRVKRYEGVTDGPSNNGMRLDVLGFFCVQWPYAQGNEEVRVLPVGHFHFHLPAAVPVRQHSPLSFLHKRRRREVEPGDNRPGWHWVKTT